MEDRYITLREHEEFKERMDEANHRQNRRIDALEENVKQIGTLTTAVEKLAVSMESMVKEQGRQGRDIEELKSRDGQMWRKVTGYIITAILGIVIGFVFRQIGL